MLPVRTKKDPHPKLNAPALADYLRDSKFRRAYERLMPEYARINARMTLKSQHQLLACHLGLAQRALDRRLRQPIGAKLKEDGVIHLSKRTWRCSALLARLYGVTPDKYIDLVLQSEFDRIDPWERRRLFR